MFVGLGSRYSVNRPVAVSSRTIRSDIIDPVHASPFLSMTTSYGFDQGVGTGHSLICFVFGSSTPTASPSYSANQRRFCASTLPLRGRELGIEVWTTSSFLLAEYD